MEKFANDDRVEQMNAQKRRMRIQEHKREVENLIDERRARKEFEKQKVRLLPTSSRHRHCFDSFFALVCFSFLFSSLFFVFQEQEASQKQNALEDARRQIVEQERQRLLEQHATRLLGHLPKVPLSAEACVCPDL